ncbi:hypothetical protein [Sandarakinorhabdus sp. AAP62]|uniref:hypothetical protein n=1 Tax=Sandarakinorhabdus sp. AAP62 TaxID=1248916 RepID=UPI0003058401|nr:hypothetical protein [Sandarakinorhabdus sp. AAP62]
MDDNVLHVRFNRPEADANERLPREQRDRIAWRETWLRAWRMETGVDQRKTLDRIERAHMAAAFRSLVLKLKTADGNRLAKVQEALENASENMSDVNYRRERGCPQDLLTLLAKAGSKRERTYRLERFDGRDPDNLRGKLIDWLAVVEAIGEQLGVPSEQQVAQFVAEVQDRQRRKPVDRPVTGLAEAYAELYADLAEDLRRICAEVARQHDIASYYHLADQAAAWWLDAKFQFNEGEADGFATENFMTGSWRPLSDDAPFFENAGLGPLGDILVYVPLGGVDFGQVEVTGEDKGHFYLAPDDEPVRISLEFHIHLVLRPDIPESDQVGGLLLQPHVAAWPDQATNEIADMGPHYPLPTPIWVSDAGKQFLARKLPRPSSTYLQAMRRLAFVHCGEIRIEPLTAESCQDWLCAITAESNRECDEFFPWPRGEWSWQQPTALPTFTLGGSIQLNLLIPDHSDEVGHRIDQLLRLEAARKVASARAALEQRKAAYRAQRNGPDRSSALPPIPDEGEVQ